MTSGPALPGWDELDGAFLDGHRGALGAADLARFWDGGRPDWRHALAAPDDVPRRQIVADAVAALGGGATFVLLVGPAGGGRSTALGQIAVDLATTGLRVLVRRPGAACDPEAVAGLPEGGGWVLVGDDADEIAREVVRAAEAITAAERHDVRWVLAARDADWERQFPRGEPWERFGVEWPPRAARTAALALTEDDAERVARAWGGNLPGELRAGTVLVRGVLEARRPDLGRQLDEIDAGLRDAFRYAAAAEAVGIDGVDLRVVADLVGVPRDDRTSIRTGLGRAGLGSGTGEALRTRDPSQARAAVQLMDIGEVFTTLVRGTAKVARQTRPIVSDAVIVTGSPGLAVRLGALGIAPDRAHEIACAAADVAAEALDNLLMTALFRSRTYRNAGRGPEAAAALHAAIDTASDKDDWAETARSFVCELSLDATTPAAATVIAGVSLADLRGLGPVSMVDASAALARLGLASAVTLPDGTPPDGTPPDETSPDGTTPDETARRLLRAVAWLGRRVTPNFDPVKSDFRRYAAQADALGVPDCTSSEAVQWLGEAIAAAFATVEDQAVHDLVAMVIPDGSLGFMQLQRTADKGANLVG